MNPAMLLPMLLVLAAGGMISLQAPTNASIVRSEIAFVITVYRSWMAQQNGA